MPRAADNDALFLPDAEIARRVIGKQREREWQGIAIVLERQGLPKPDPMMGGRYWPAVKAFFDRRHRLSDSIGPSANDGEENWDERGSRPRTRPRMASP